ncbi:MAG TPA: 3-phosphoshikimate 1-carboxyvinyltransferase [Acidobacteriota bacterium]|nr:3-phosphoshikimate 1-carboxyvinyltransferase [Acidobacteriota bacterium]
MTQDKTTTESRQDARLEPVRKLTGHYRPPTDKSIAHRALILAALAKGRSTVAPITRSEDVAATARCLRQLGVTINESPDGWIVESPGVNGWTAPERGLDCGNSGTTMRLLAGCLVGRPFASTLIGDDSLSRRPMRRIAEPLRLMGAEIDLAKGDTAPIRITGIVLDGVEYTLPVPSAQVKSAILLAGLSAQGETVITERIVSRDHTERMLDAAGVDCVIEYPPRAGDRREAMLASGAAEAVKADYQRLIRLGERREVQPHDWVLPGDFSAAAFFIAAAVGVKKSDLIVADVGLNPKRTGFLKVLKRMGVDYETTHRENSGGEPRGRIRIAAFADLKATKVGAAEIPTLIDELPILAVLAARAEGVTVIRGAEELRHKESDRIAAVAANLRAMGAKVAELEDGWAIEGPTEWHAATIDPQGDHRIAMAFSIAALWADGPSVIRNAGIVRVSDPEFFAALTALTH